MDKYIPEFPIGRTRRTYYNRNNAIKKLQKLIPEEIHQEWKLVAAFGIWYNIYNKETDELIAKLKY